jgi:hypothetical protein
MTERPPLEPDVIAGLKSAGWMVVREDNVERAVRRSVGRHQRVKELSAENTDLHDVLVDIYDALQLDLLPMVRVIPVLLESIEDVLGIEVEQ